MNYTKSMIDLIKEIRRRADAETKPLIKMANPELLVELKDIFHASSDVISQALIKELFALAGEPWTSALSKPQVPEERQIIKTYRGQTQLVESPMESSKPESQSGASKRVYRGQVIPAG